MILDACAALVRSTVPRAPELSWREEWRASAGCGVVAGLLDTGFDEAHADLAGADVVVRDFAAARPRPHGTCSVTTFIGQGRSAIRGIAPRARLLVATVIAPGGSATEEAVARGLDWLIDGGAQVIAAPMGGRLEHREIARAMDRAEAAGAMVFASIGSGWSDDALFPARHPFAIAVGAADANGTTWFDRGRVKRLDLLAPGWSITAPVGLARIGTESGSSVACVIACAVAALGISAGAVAPRTTRSALLAALRAN